MTAVSEPDRLQRDERSNIERIRHAALMNFASHGTSATTLRAVAADAGVSLGLVQHHFVTKARLIDAVDDHVLRTVMSVVAQPLPGPSADSVTEVGNRVFALFANHPDIAEYIGRTLVDGSPLGATIFDTLLNSGLARWHRRAERGETHPDLDLTWAAINSLILALGPISLRVHIERHLSESLTGPVQLERWLTAANSLMQKGLFREPEGAWHVPSDGMPQR
jgi:AcrR family transcriptional regulator